MNQYTALKSVLLDKHDNTPFLKGNWTRTDVTTVTQLLKTAELLKPFYSAESVLLERVIYKNKNQHQRARYYKRIQQILKRIRAVDIGDLIEWIRSTFPTSDETISPQNPTPRTAWESHAIYVLYKLYGLSLYLTEINEYILSAYELLAHQLEQTYFMALALALITTLARFFNLHHKLISHVTALYDATFDHVRTDHDTLIARGGQLMTRVTLYRSLIGPLPHALHVTAANVQKKKKKKKQFDQLLTRVTQSTPQSEASAMRDSAVKELNTSLRVLSHDDEDLGETLSLATQPVTAVTQPVTAVTQPATQTINATDSDSESVGTPRAVSSAARGVKRKRADERDESSALRASPSPDTRTVGTKKKKLLHGPDAALHTHTLDAGYTPDLARHTAHVMKVKNRPNTPFEASNTHSTKSPSSTPSTPSNKSTSSNKGTPSTPSNKSTQSKAPALNKAHAPMNVNTVFASLLSGKKKKK